MVARKTKNKMKPFVFVCSVLMFLFSFVFQQSVFADEGWDINSFDASAMFEEATGKMQVTEKIAVDFASLEKHGIYRDIPYVYEEDNGAKTYTTVDVIEVLQDGKDAEIDLSKNEGNIRIRIGDPDKTISGNHTYEISYDVLGVLRSFADHDELYWNVTGEQWGVHILKTSFSLTLPKSGIQKVSCFQGVGGSTDACLAEISSEKTAVFNATRSLGAYEGMTVVVGFQKGLLPIVTVARPKTVIEKLLEWPSQTTFLIILVSGILTVFTLWFRYGRDSWFKNVPNISIGAKTETKPIGSVETVVVEFEPPERLRPAEIGVLMDERAHTHDVVATIIDLASRGFLTITEIPKKWLFGSIDYTLTRKTKSEDELLLYEKTLLSELFGSAKEVSVSSLKQTFYQELQKVKTQLYEDVVKKGLFPSNPEKVRQKYLLIAIIGVVLGVTLTIVSVSNEIILLADLSLGVTISSILLVILSPFMSKRTALGRDMYRRSRGYLLFISGAEKYRQQFFEKKNMFNEVLPYTIVFGLTEKFITAMKDIGLSEKSMSPSWYYGTSVFHASTFTQSMNSFSSSLSSAIASAPKSSGFSSGGSSGGGFGGGGGGSW